MLRAWCGNSLLWWCRKVPFELVSSRSSRDAGQLKRGLVSVIYWNMRLIQGIKCYRSVNGWRTHTCCMCSALPTCLRPCTSNFPLETIL